MTKDDILQRIASIMEDTFEIDPARVRLDAKLYDDLEIDSIDAVDLIVQLKPLAGRRLDPQPSSRCAPCPTWSRPCTTC